MKRLIYSALFALGLVPVLESCQPQMDFLNPESEVIDTYYASQEHLIYAVNAAYNIPQILQSWGRNMPYILNTRSDEALYTFKAAAGDPTVVELSGYTVTAAHGLTSEIYSNLYTLQYTANLALEKLEEYKDLFDMNKEEDKALYDRLRGEAYFFRGFSRFYLVFLFGDEIPDRSYTAKDLNDYYAFPAEKGVIYQNMVQDFKDAASLLPSRTVLYQNEENWGRVTKGTAQVFLAKAYMGRPILDGTAEAGSADWSAAKAVLEEVVTSGDYDLVENYRDNSSEANENNIESLYEIQFNKSLDASVAMSLDVKDFGQNSWRQVCMTLPDPIGWWNAMPSLSLYNEFERDENGKIIDPRAYLGLWIPDGATYQYTGKIGDKNYEAQRLTYEEMFGGQDPAWLGKWFGTRKFGCDDNTVMDMQRSGSNERVLRYADALLMYAECCLETGDEATALAYINKVRDRANNRIQDQSGADAGMFYVTEGGHLPKAEEVIAAAPVLGKVVDKNGQVVSSGVQINTVRRMLKHEYSVELFMEGWRFFNLMRWYNNPNDPDHNTVLDCLVNKCKVQIEQTGLVGAVPFDYKKHLRLPIPSVELQNNPNMHGNQAN